MKLVVPVFLASLIVLVSSCMQKQLIKAEEAYQGQQYCDGASQLVAIYPKLKTKGEKAKKAKGDMAFQIAESYKLSMSYQDANEWYKRAIDLDYATVKPEVFLYNGQVLQLMNKLAEAQKNFEEYKKIAPNDPRGDVGIQSCKSNAEMKEDKTKHLVENQATLNSKEYDMSPMFGDKKNTKMYFSSTRNGGFSAEKDSRTCESYMDLWVTTLDNKGNWGEPKLVVGEGVNTEDSEGTVCFDGKGKQMFFTRCPNEKKQNLGCDIWVAELKGKEEFANATKLELKTNDTVSVGHPCVSDDGKYLIFASDMPGGLGGRDLWYTTFEKKTNKWAAPINLGKEINTAGNEMFPTFAKNGDLIFATDGMIGLGGLDIFIAKKVGEEYKWENPKNLGAPINSESDDYSLIELTDKKGYFTSDRKSPNGSKPDLYSYVLPPNLYDLKVLVSEKGNRSVKLADVAVVVKGSDNTTWEGKTSKDGSVFWDKKPTGERFINENVTYNVTIAKDGYYEYKKLSEISTMNSTDNQSFVLDMELLPIKPIRLPEVRYPLGLYTLLVDSTINSKDSLNFVDDLLNEYPGMVLELSSHTDSRGKDAANQILSENRAKECVRYLVEEKGVDPNRLKAVGKGETQPATWVDPQTGEKILLTEAYINQFKEKDKVKFEMLHQLNRRTEGKVLTLDYVPGSTPSNSSPTPPTGK